MALVVPVSRGSGADGDAGVGVGFGIDPESGSDPDPDQAVQLDIPSPPAFRGDRTVPERQAGGSVPGSVPPGSGRA